MTSVGLKWDGLELEVGFSARSRPEYEDHLLKIAAFVDRVWSPGALEPDLSRDPAEPPRPGDFAEPPSRASNREAKRREWLERQGLA